MQQTSKAKYLVTLGIAWFVGAGASIASIKIHTDAPPPTSAPSALNQSAAAAGT